MATKKIQILDSLNKNAVLYTPQELTDEEKAQARENIGAVAISDLNNALQDKQDSSNLTTVIDATSTDTQYPSAKAVYDLIGDCNAIIDSISTLVGGEDI